jgi:hypothetical protein
MQLRTAADIAAFIIADPWRRAVLEAVRRQCLPDWAIGAGFIRTPVWDALHGHAEPTPLPDIDVLFFDSNDLSRQREAAIDAALVETLSNVPWSAKNQARMHLRNDDAPYADTADALQFWLETPTAVAVRIGDDGAPVLLAPYGVDDLLAMTCRPTPSGRRRWPEYESRMREKNWPARWPRVRVLDSTPPPSFGTAG